MSVSVDGRVFATVSYGLWLGMVEVLQPYSNVCGHGWPIFCDYFNDNGYMTMVMDGHTFVTIF